MFSTWCLYNLSDSQSKSYVTILIYEFNLLAKTITNLILMTCLNHKWPLGWIYTCKFLIKQIKNLYLLNLHNPFSIMKIYFNRNNRFYIDIIKNVIELLKSFAEVYIIEIKLFRPKEKRCFFMDFYNLICF